MACERRRGRRLSDFLLSRRYIIISLPRPNRHVSAHRTAGLPLVRYPKPWAIAILGKAADHSRVGQSFMKTSEGVFNFQRTLQVSAKMHTLDYLAIERANRSIHF